MLFCLETSHRSPNTYAMMTYNRESDNPVQYRLFVADQALRIIFDGAKPWSGHVLRPADGLEAYFSNRDGLEHVLEGLIGRRAWAQYRQQVVTLLDQFLVD